MVRGQIICGVKDYVLLAANLVELLLVILLLLIFLVFDILFDVTGLNRQFLIFIVIGLFLEDSVLLQLTCELAKLFTACLRGKASIEDVEVMLGLFTSPTLHVVTSSISRYFVIVMLDLSFLLQEFCNLIAQCLPFVFNSVKGHQSLLSLLYNLKPKLVTLPTAYFDSSLLTRYSSNLAMHVTLDFLVLIKPT